MTQLLPRDLPDYEFLDLTGPSLPRSGRGPVLALGVFDGVHLGHRSLLGAGLDMARRDGRSLWALTFWPHPEQVLRPTQAPRGFLLSTLEEKIRLLSLAGAAKVLIVRFSREAADLQADEFVRRTLVDGLSASGIIVGFNFTFGRGGRGNPPLLRRLGRNVGLKVAVHPAVRLGADVVSSSSVRESLARGDVERAGLLLGRTFSLSGPIVAGEGRGRTLGFPTANVAFPTDLAVPAAGVYVCSVAKEAPASLGPSLQVALPAVANIGFRPTFSGATVGTSFPALEVHVLSGVVPGYGTGIRVYFHAQLRAERRFAGAADLAVQIGRDRDRAAAFFGLDNPAGGDLGGRA
jgi:riboflavin kinase/FMN adenylyltransferase